MPVRFLRLAFINRPARSVVIAHDLPNTTDETALFNAITLGEFFQLGEVLLNQNVSNVRGVDVVEFVRFFGVGWSEQGLVATAIVTNGSHDVGRGRGPRSFRMATG